MDVHREVLGVSRQRYHQALVIPSLPSGYAAALTLAGQAPAWGSDGSHREGSRTMLWGAAPPSAMEQMGNGGEPSAPARKGWKGEKLSV